MAVGMGAGTQDYFDRQWSSPLWRFMMPRMQLDIVGSRACQWLYPHDRLVVGYPAPTLSGTELQVRSHGFRGSDFANARFAAKCTADTARWAGAPDSLFSSEYGNRDRLREEEPNSRKLTALLPYL